MAGLRLNIRINAFIHKLILFLSINCLFVSCDTSPLPLPFEINKRVIYNRDCDFILYSTNEEDFFNPSILYNPFGSDKIKKSLKLPSGVNYYVRDASCDCKHVLLVTEKLRENKYDIYLYNLDTEAVHNITDGIHSTFEDPMFLNQNTILFLKDGVLHSYGIHDKSWRYFPSDQKFKHLFIEEGKYVFLQDAHSSLWKFEIDEKALARIWEAPKVFTSSRKVRVHGGKIFFIGDHKTGFNSIYCITMDNPAEIAMLSDQHDYFIVNNSFFLGDTLTYIKNEGLYFVSSVNQLPQNGVLYDFVAKNDSLLMLYADSQKPASLYLISESGMVDLLQQYTTTIPYDVVIENKKEGVDNLLFLPKAEIKQWVVWLHGGPHEQVSNRFNPYIYHLVLNNIGVIALNYPGSTGNGNEFELRAVPVQHRLDIQIEVIKEDLNVITDKYNIDSFSLIGVSYGSILAHQLAWDANFNVEKLIDFSGINTSQNLVGSSLETLYIMGDHDFVLSNNQRVELLNEHQKKGAKILVLKKEGHTISRKTNMDLIIDEVIGFLRDN